MAKKTIIKRLCKYLPLSVEVQRGLAVDETTKVARKDMQDEEEIIYEADLTDWTDKVITVEAKETEAQPTEDTVPQAQAKTQTEQNTLTENPTEKTFKNPFVKDE